MQIDGFEVLDATVEPDGSYSTQLLDASGNVAATVTRLANGVSTANVTSDSGPTEWESVLAKVTGLLDKVAQNATGISDEASRIANAAKGAVAGARIGYHGPISWTPWVVGTVAIVIGLALSNGSRSRER